MLAVTGSNGKTSVKALTFAILEAAVAAQGMPGRSLHHAGQSQQRDRSAVGGAGCAGRRRLYAIYEMGAGKPGDIAYLTDIVQSGRGAWSTTSRRRIIERMGSLLGIADTKAAIYDALCPADGVAAINADDAFARVFRGTRRMDKRV